VDMFFSDKPSKIGILKMDIEGSEFEALTGMKNLIDVNKNMKLFLEFNPYVLTRHGTDLESFIH
jgi:methyltransferase FkbM-like protein